MLVKPSRSSLCAVVIPTHKTLFSSIELFCLQRSLEVLASWDIFFVIPDNLDVPEPSVVSNHSQICLSSNHFISNDSYNRLFFGDELFIRFLHYDRILICQPDAIVLRDEIYAWSRCPYDVIGAPWFGGLKLRVSSLSLPDLCGKELTLEAGNGGLCLLNPRAVLNVQARYAKIFREFGRRAGPQIHQDALFSLIGTFDQYFRVAPTDLSARFSLERGARAYLSSGNPYPMGFHALYKYDPELWMSIFPESPSAAS